MKPTCLHLCCHHFGLRLQHLLLGPWQWLPHWGSFSQSCPLQATPHPAARRILLKCKSGHVTFLLKTLLQFPKILRKKSKAQMSWLLSAFPIITDLSCLYPCSALSGPALLQPALLFHKLPSSFPPWDLCICCFHCLECSFSSHSSNLS